MGARHKLNSAAINGILVIAGLVAFFAQSWDAFWIIAVILTLSALFTGEIRFGGGNRRR